MLLQTVIDHLKTGEFYLENLGGNDEENISSNNINLIINFVKKLHVNSIYFYFI